MAVRRRKDSRHGVYQKANGRQHMGVNHESKEETKVQVANNELDDRQDRSSWSAVSGKRSVVNDLERYDMICMREDLFFDLRQKRRDISGVDYVCK